MPALAPFIFNSASPKILSPFNVFNWLAVISVFYVDLSLGTVTNRLVQKIKHVYDAGMLKSQYFSHLSHGTR